MVYLSLVTYAVIIKIVPFKYGRINAMPHKDGCSSSSYTIRCTMNDAGCETFAMHNIFLLRIIYF